MSSGLTDNCRAGSELMSLIENNLIILSLIDLKSFSIE